MLGITLLKVAGGNTPATLLITLLLMSRDQTKVSREATDKANASEYNVKALKKSVSDSSEVVSRLRAKEQSIKVRHGVLVNSIFWVIFTHLFSPSLRKK